MKKTILMIGCAALVVAPTFANAQLGGLLSSAKGTQISNTGTPTDFINNTTNTAKYLWTSSEYINYVLSNSKDNAALKAKVESINKISDLSELSKNTDAMKTSVDAAGAKTQDAALFENRYKESDANQKAAMGMAVYNLALGALNATRLSQDASNFANAVKSNPMAYVKDGKDIFAAMKVVGVLAVSTGKLMVNLPKLATIAKVELPKDASAGKPHTINM